MQIYNTLTRKKEELVPMTAGHMGIYACGPTVYNYITSAMPARSVHSMCCGGI